MRSPQRPQVRRQESKALPARTAPAEPGTSENNEKTGIDAKVVAQEVRHSTPRGAAKLTSCLSIQKQLKKNSCRKVSG
jgi:hypothetical protein